MKYLPLVWAAFRRHTTESLLTFLVLTIAFTLFSSMVALQAAYEQAITMRRGWTGCSSPIASAAPG